MISFPRTVTKDNKSRTDQDTIIPEKKQAVVGGLNGKDIMAILPTGFGKSVIFELFTLVKMLEDELT